MDKKHFKNFVRICNYLSKEVFSDPDLDRHKNYFNAVRGVTSLKCIKPFQLVTDPLIALPVSTVYLASSFHGQVAFTVELASPFYCQVTFTPDLASPI